MDGSKKFNSVSGDFQVEDGAKGNRALVPGSQFSVLRKSERPGNLLPENGELGAES